jgi:hypothetical protein
MNLPSLPLSTLRYGMLVVTMAMMVMPSPAQSTPAAPQVVLKVENCLKASPGSASSNVCEVANNTPIALKISLKSSGSAAGIDVDPAMINPNQVPSDGTYYVIKVSRQSDGTTVPVIITNGHRSVQLGEKATHVLLEIEDDPAVRRAKIEAWYNKIKASLKQDNPGLYNIASSNDEAMIKGFDRQLIENQLGQFQIVCSYFSTKPGTWNGEVDSSPVVINVEDKGTMLEK